MNRVRSYFKIDLPTKPFIKKFLYASYGNPLLLSASADDPVGMLVSVSLGSKKVYPNYPKEFVQRSFEQYTDIVTISLPLSWLKNYYYGSSVPEKNIMFVNNFLEGMFAKSLAEYCDSKTREKGDRQQAIYDFCWKRGIEIPEDITFDALKQTEFRYRKKLKKKKPSNLSPTK